MSSSLPLRKLKGWQIEILFLLNCVEICSERGAVQLVGSANMTEGLLELCADGHWGTVCNDGFDTNAAMVVCRQLGFHESSELPRPLAIHYDDIFLSFSRGSIKYLLWRRTYLHTHSP